jgi:hypothetical protein
MNAMGDAVGGAQHLISLDVAELIEQARRATGLSDFGAFDGDWQARLESLVSNMEETARLNVVGRLMIREELQRSLCTRLFLAKRWTDAPAIADEEITAPIVITGPGRSGTSILFELMSLDPAGRSPLGWEAAHPGHPNPDTRALSRMTECEQEFWEDVNPVIGTIHEHRADIPVECVTLQLPSFSGAYWWIVANIPKWVPDMPASMAFHKAVLQTLQHGGASATWILTTATRRRRRPPGSPPWRRFASNAATPWTWPRWASPREAETAPAGPTTRCSRSRPSAGPARFRTASSTCTSAR